MPTLNKLAYANRVYHGALFGLWKIAACLTYLRLMEGSHRPRMKQAIHAVLGFAIALHITYGFGNLLFCVPVRVTHHLLIVLNINLWESDSEELALICSWSMY